MNILLIYQLVPENTHMVLLRDVDAKTAADLESIAGTYVNGDDLSDEQQAVHDAVDSHLAEDKEYGDGLWFSFRLDETQVNSVPECKIIMAGFLL